MCDPATIAGLALSVGSTALGAIGASKAQKAHDQTMAAERERQGKLDREADAINATSQGRYENFDAQRDTKAQELGDYFADQKVAGQADAQATQALNVPQSGSNVVTQEEAKQKGKAEAFTDAQGQRLGDLRSFGDLLGGISRDQARDAGYLGQIGGFKKGSAGVLPQELEVAAGAGNGYKMFGDVVGAVGSGLTAYGLQGSFAGAGKAAAAAAPAAAAAATPNAFAPIAGPVLTNVKRNGNLFNIYHPSGR